MPQQRSAVVSSEQNSPPTPQAPALSEAPLIAAARLLADRSVYGLVWLDGDLFVTARYGRLVAFVEIGQPVTDSLIALVGLEATITDLRHGDAAILELPAIAIVDSTAPATRLTLTVFWSATDAQFLVLFGRPGSQSDLEQDLSRQMRARLIAEAQVVEKSKQLVAANRELEIANRDLEDYASIISHDLKAPLRRVRYLTDDIAAALCADDTDAAHSHLTELRAQSTRMATMMTALLDYAAISHKQDAIETVDTYGVIHGICASLSPGATQTLELRGDWPTLTTLRAPLELVLRNLIDNALKHHDRPPATISVTCQLVDTHLLLTVADDGPGIQPEHHAAAVLPFRTLEQPLAPEKQVMTGTMGPTRLIGAPIGAHGNTGMGLALVVRTLEAVGGRLTIVSDPAKRRGTTMEVWWPRLVA